MQFRSSIVNINEFKCGCASNFTMIVSSFDQSRIETEIFSVVISDMEQVTVESLLVSINCIWSFMRATGHLYLICGYNCSWKLIYNWVSFIIDSTTVEMDVIVMINYNFDSIDPQKVILKWYTQL